MHREGTRIRETDQKGLSPYLTLDRWIDMDGWWLMDRWMDTVEHTDTYTHGHNRMYATTLVILEMWIKTKRPRMYRWLFPFYKWGN